MSQLDATTRTPRSPSAEQLRLIAEFDDDSNGAEALAEALRTAARRWGIWWTGELAARLAHAQATWLLTNCHPEGTHLYLHAQYDSASRRFSITVGDPGGLLPTLIMGDQWRRSLGAALEADAYHNCGRDRRVHCVMKVRAPWRVRITWDLAKVQGTHPEHTFEDRESERDVRDSVVRALQHHGVRTVHWQGPEDRDDYWREPAETDGSVAGGNAA